MRLRLILIVCALQFVASKEEMPVGTVNRRLTGDTYYFNSTEIEFCKDQNNLTFLVSDARCVNIQYFFSGKLNV